MKHVVWKFGLIAGAILSVMMLATLPFLDRIGFEYGELIGYTTIIAALLLIFFGVRSYRDNQKGKPLSFGRAFVVGVLINVVASACYVATWEFIYYKVAPDFVDKLAAHMEQEERASGRSPAEQDKRISQMKKNLALYKNPIANIAITFLEPFTVGLIVSLASAGILRRRPDTAGALADATGSLVTIA